MSDFLHDFLHHSLSGQHQHGDDTIRSESNPMGRDYFNGLNQKLGHSEPNATGGYDHFNAINQKTGHSESNAFGGADYFNDNFQKVGHSEHNAFGGTDHFDAQYHKTGHSEANAMGGHDYFNESYHKTGYSQSNGMGGQTYLSMPMTDAAHLHASHLAWMDQVTNPVHGDPLKQVHQLQFPTFI